MHIDITRERRGRRCRSRHCDAVDILDSVDSVILCTPSLHSSFLISSQQDAMCDESANLHGIQSSF